MNYIDLRKLSIAVYIQILIGIFFQFYVLFDITRYTIYAGDEPRLVFIVKAIADAKTMDAARSIFSTMEGLTLFFLITSLVIFIAWCFQAHKNLKPLSAPELKFSSIGVLIWLQVPVINLWKSKGIVEELYHQSTSNYQKNPKILRLWWPCFLVFQLSLIVMAIYLVVGTNFLHFRLVLPMVTVLGMGYIAFGVCSISLVRKITQFQRYEAAEQHIRPLYPL